MTRAISRVRRQFPYARRPHINGLAHLYRFARRQLPRPPAFAASRRPRLQSRRFDDEM